MRVTPERSRSIFNNPRMPTSVSEKQFDGFDRELRKIAKTEWKELNEEDLWFYLHDLAYVELQSDLFDYLFPVCLNFWYQSLMRSESAERGDAEFHYSLYRGNLLNKMTTKEQTQEIYSYFIDGFLDRIEAERGFKYSGSSTPAYSWIARFNSLGYISPIIDQICDLWWTLDQPGKAVSAVMYASGLVYLRGDNPIFGDWTCNKGGGGPYLTESDAHIFDIGWLPENIEFLKEKLSVEYIQNKLHKAASMLSSEPEAEISLKVATDSLLNGEIIELRIGDLIEGLSQAEGRAQWD